MQPAGLRGQRRHPHGATLAGPAENERDPGAERLSGVAGRATASRPASQTAPEPLVPFPPPAPARGPGSAGGAMPNAAGRGGITPAGSSLLSCCVPGPRAPAVSAPRTPPISQPPPRAIPARPPPVFRRGPPPAIPARCPHLYPNRPRRPSQLAPHTRDPSTARPTAPSQEPILAPPRPPRGPAPRPLPQALPPGFRLQCPGVLGLESDPGSGAGARRRPHKRPWDPSPGVGGGGLLSPENKTPPPLLADLQRPWPLASPPPTATTLLPARPSRQPQGPLGLQHPQPHSQDSPPLPRMLPSRDLE